MSRLSSKGSDWEALRQQVLTRDGHLCQICRVAQATTVDHITPKNRGGEDVLDNLQAACRRCNGKKQDTMVVRSTYHSPRWFAR